MTDGGGGIYTFVYAVWVPTNIRIHVGSGSESNDLVVRGHMSWATRDPRWSITHDRNWYIMVNTSVPRPGPDSYSRVPASVSVSAIP